jgi:ankyrin repeat protein
MKTTRLIIALTGIIFILSVTAKGDDTADILSAAEKGDLQKIKTLYTKNPALVNAKDSDFSRTVLMRAAENGYRDITEFLLSKGVSVDLKDKDGMTALIYAAMWNQISVVEILIAKGAAVNIKDKAGMTPLHYAASNGHRETVEYLLLKGADISAKDKSGKTPLKWANDGSFSEIAELLKNKGAKD